MQIGETIRKFRKERNMTQEEMARRLGVTPPAVNKWENGNSYPDILLLAPIARLLDISLDTLLSFHGELTQEEIRDIVVRVDEKFKEEPYEEVFLCAKRELEKYPGSDQLTWQLAVILDAHRLLKEVPEPEKYDSFITECYTRAMKSEDESTRYSAAEALYNFYLRKEQYEEAEKCLEHFSMQNPEKKRRQALIFSRTGRPKEAYKAYEELLFSDYQMISMIFNGLYMMAIQEGDLEKARYFVDKQRVLARLFEMGEYYEVSPGLELAAMEMDEEATIEIAENMLSCIEQIQSFTRAPLYSHMTFKHTDGEFLAEMKQELLKNFREEETYGFLKGNSRWEKLLEGEGN